MNKELDNAIDSLEMAEEYVKAYRQGKEHPLGRDGAEELLTQITKIIWNYRTPLDTVLPKWYQRLPRLQVSITFKWEPRWPCFAMGFIGHREFVLMVWSLLFRVNLFDERQDCAKKDNQDISSDLA